MFSGYFLNLNRSQRRRAALTSHLVDIGADSCYRRFEAVDGRAIAHAYATKLDPGALGLWLSHERLLQTQNAANVHLHIIEDDVIFARDAMRVFAEMLQYADTHLGFWDLLFTDIFVPTSIDIFRSFAHYMEVYLRSRSYSFLDLADIHFASTCSFFINRRSVAKYASQISGKWVLGLPIDLYLRHLVHQKELKAFVVCPFPTTVSAESDDSDIRGNLEISRRVCRVLRRAFFQEADHESLLAQMMVLTEGTAVSPLTELFLSVERFMLSSRYTHF